MKKELTRNLKESDIQKSIIEYLNWREKMIKDIYFFRSNSFSGKVIRPNGSIGWIRNQKKGVPDIIALYKGRWIGLEVKRQGTYQSKDQKLAQAQIEACGGIYKVVRSVEEVELLLK